MADEHFAVAVDRYLAGAARRRGIRPAMDAGAGPADLLVASQELETIAARSVASGDRDVRELGTMQLAAGAALDLAVALDLLAPPGTALAVGAGHAEVESVAAQLGPVLAAPSPIGARVMSAEIDLTAATTASLATSTNAAIDGIVATAEKMAGHAVHGLLGLPASVIPGALLQTADALFGPLLRQAGDALRWALRHILKAVSKLLRLLGPLEDRALTWLQEQLGDAVQERLAGWTVEAALGVDDVRAAADVILAGVAADADYLRPVAAEIASLPDRLGRHETVVKVLTMVLGKLRDVILALASWAGVALAGVYLLILTYAVWTAGDFLDWLRTREQGRLDLVAGVLGNLRLAAAAPAS